MPRVRVDMKWVDGKFGYYPFVEGTTQPVKNFSTLLYGVNDTFDPNQSIQVEDYAHHHSIFTDADGDPIEAIVTGDLRAHNATIKIKKKGKQIDAKEPFTADLTKTLKAWITVQ